MNEKGDEVDSLVRAYWGRSGC